MSKRSAKNKRIVIALVVIALVAVGGALYIKAHQKSSTATYNPQSKTTASGQGADNQSGGVVDNNAAGKGSASSGSTTSQPTAGKPTSSASGVITLTSPTSGASMGNGAAVTGTASGLSQVQYRIKAADGNVVALGQLTVLNGGFSGTIGGLQSDLSGSSGTFEVYDYKNGNGPEENDAKINVSFK